MDRKSKHDEIRRLSLVTPPIPESDEEAWKELPGLLQQQGLPPPALRRLRRLISDRHPSAATLASKIDDSVYGDCVYGDGLLLAWYGHRACVVSTKWDLSQDVMPDIVEIGRQLGLNAFVDGIRSVYRANGYTGQVLRVESRPPVPGPTEWQISDAVDQLTPDGGPGFLILQGQSSDYAQAAGGNGVYTVEWRDHRGQWYRHWKAGLPGKPVGAWVRVATNGHSVKVRENECLSIQDTKAILVAFAHDEKRPVQYAWRDMTEEVAQRRKAPSSKSQIPS